MTMAAGNLATTNQGMGGIGGIAQSLNWYTGIAFVCGVASARVVNLIGEIYVGELMIVQFAFLLLVLGHVKRVFGLPALAAFVQLAVLMLVGYIVADVYRDAQAAQFLRGWSRIILVTLDFLALVIVSAQDKRNAWWFVLGMGLEIGRAHV